MGKEWTLTALYSAMIKDLELCQTEAEKINCKAICSKEIRTMAEELKNVRKLTPGEVSVLVNI